jgi:CheY-like chemotaxis protein
MLQEERAPHLVLLDWSMPHLDGLEVCRRVRQLPQSQSPYIILVTAKGGKEDVVAGLEAGADDYISKPFDPGELKARLLAGVRIVELQRNLAERVDELEAALARVTQLHGLLPICGYCKRIRDDQNYWQQVESYISSHADVSFSHGVCPDCYEQRVKPELEAIRGKIAGKVEAPSC